MIDDCQPKVVKNSDTKRNQETWHGESIKWTLKKCAFILGLDL